VPGPGAGPIGIGLFSAAILVLASIGLAGDASASDSAGDPAATDGSPTASASAEPSPEVGFKAGSFIAVPIPVNDPTFGTGLVLGGGYLFKADETSNTSFLGGGAFGTDGGSRAAAVGGSISLDDKRYNGFAFLGAADLKYDLFILGRPARIEQQAVAFQGQFRYGFSDTLSAGVSLRYVESNLAGANGSDLSPEIQNLTDVKIGTVGVVAQRDTRDDTFYPTTGSLLDVGLTYSEEVGGANLTYAGATIGFDQFWSLGPRSVIGARVAGCMIENRAPFFDSCLLGAEIRGFSLFEFYGSQMLTAQAEYRGRLNDRFGYVAFAGVGEVQRNLTSLDSGTRYAGGLGLRYRVSRDFDLDVSLDVTLNDQRDSLVYFYVGQNF
jgi:outer membrane protein assembly factor BamA